MPTISETKKHRQECRAMGNSLINAVASGEITKAKSLIKNGAEVNHRNSEGETPLTFAATWNQLECLKLLLTHGADPNLADNTGGTALMLAAQHGSPQMVRVLLQKGADPSQKDSHHRTALQHVAWRASGGLRATDAIRRMLSRHGNAAGNGER
jgi:uncharacterized protein